MASRIIQFSDIHVRGPNDLSRLDAIDTYVSQNKVDGVFFLGDIVDGFSLLKTQFEVQEHMLTPEIVQKIKDGKLTEEENERLEEVVQSEVIKIFKATDERINKRFASIKKKSPLYGLLGNHDPEDVYEKFKENIDWLDLKEGVEIGGVWYAGCANLGKETIPSIKIGGKPIHLPGEMYAYLQDGIGKKDYDRIKAGFQGKDKKILVTHNPFKGINGNKYEHVPEIEQLVNEEKPNAMLSGHVHVDSHGSLLNGVPYFASSHLVGYEHEVDDAGEIAASWRIWLIPGSEYKKHQEEFKDRYSVYVPK